MDSVTKPNDFWIYGQCDHRKMISEYMGNVNLKKWFLNIWAMWPHYMISEYMDSVTTTKWFLITWVV